MVGQPLLTLAGAGAPGLDILRSAHACRGQAQPDDPAMGISPQFTPCGGGSSNCSAHGIDPAAVTTITDSCQAVPGAGRNPSIWGWSGSSDSLKASPASWYALMETAI